MRTTALVGWLILALPIPAAPVGAQEPPRARADHPLRDPYITGTGATVDKPGEPQGSAPTALDRGVQRQDNRIDGSICRGC